MVDSEGPDDPPEEEGPDPGAVEALQRRRAIEALKARLQAQPPTPKDHLDDPLTQLERRTDIELKKLYAKGILWILGLQMFVVNVGIFFYGFGNDWDVDPIVLEFWLSATVVEVIGVVLLVTRYLFPSRTKDDEAATVSRMPT